MTVNNKDLFFDGIWDWAMFDGCFGETRIKPTDLDGFVERKGKFLVLETKHKDTPIPEGQRITFESLVKTGYFSILVMWGDKNKPERALLITRKGEKEYNPVDIDKCSKIVSAWFEYAETFS
jgi:hypothetical protein